MKKVLLIFLAIVAITSATTAIEKHSNEGITGRGIILDAQGKKVVETFVKRFQNGYKKDELNISLDGIEIKIKNFTAMGLDNVEIKKLKIGYTFGQAVKFNFLLPEVIVSGKTSTDPIINLLKKYGIDLPANVDINFELFLKNVRFQGGFKYTMPLMFFSIKIYKFDASITIDTIVSKMDGVLGNGILNKLLNKTIGNLLLKLVDSRQDEISSLLKNNLVPFVNSQLDGQNLLTIIGEIIC